MQRADDWGYVYYSPDPLAPNRFGGSAERKRGYVFKDGESLLARWPNGSVSEARVRLKRYSDTVHDMGHSYEVGGRYPVLLRDVDGVSLEVPLDQVEIEASALDGRARGLS